MKMVIGIVLLRAVCLAFLINVVLFPHSVHSEQRNFLVVLLLGLPALFVFSTQFLKLKNHQINTGALLVVLTTLVLYFSAPYAAEYDMSKSVAYCETLIERAQAIKSKRGTYPKRLKEIWYEKPKHLLYASKGCGYRRVSGDEISLAIAHNTKLGSLQFSSKTDTWEFKPR